MDFVFEIASQAFREMPLHDIRKQDWDSLRALSGVDGLRLVNVGADDVPALMALGFDRLRSVSFRHLRTRDLTALKPFSRVELMQVWQSDDVTSLDGIQGLQMVRCLSLSELGPLPSLEPLSELHGLQELLLTGGFWKDQKLAGDFAPLAALTNLRRLAITNIRGPVDLSPLLGFRRLEELSVATALFPVDQIARLAARYRSWAEQRPLMRRFEHAGPCSQCGDERVLLLLQRKKRVWCQRCEAGRLAKVVGQFDRLIQQYQS
jgi:DNA-directed RNA polymerase subunit RPC12/RpoP